MDHRSNKGIRGEGEKGDCDSKSSFCPLSSVLCPLILIGYRATGKTTLARLLAEKLGVAWYDSDVLIEQRAGKSIARIFAEDGETAFRDTEENEIAKILENADRPIVLATGGGAILRESIRSLLKRKGFVVWLTASKETIHRRMKQDVSTAERRPDLTNLPAEEEIAHLLETRRAFYEETAHLTVDTETKIIENLVEEIFLRYNNTPH